MIGLVIFTIISCWILVYQSSRDLTVKRAPVFVEEKCYPLKNALVGSRISKEFSLNATYKVKKRVLLATRRTSVAFRSEISRVLEESRIPYEFVYLEIGDRTVFPKLSHGEIGRFSAVIFESIKFYATLDIANRHFLDHYCRKFGIGIVLFTVQEAQEPNTRIFKEFHFGIKAGVSDLRNVELNPSACVLRLTRAGGIIEEPPKSKWSVFFPNHSTYEAVEFATKETAYTTLNTNKQTSSHNVKFEDLVLKEGVSSTRFTTVLTDLGHLDGVRRIYFGNGLSFWLHKLLFLDGLAFVSRGNLAQSLERRIVVDIDDIFVGKAGIRMTKEDVRAMVSVQAKLQEHVPGFHFNLGYSGGMFLSGNDEEDEGDWELIKNADKFWWFSHMWLHRQPHKSNTLDQIVEDLKTNLEFAREHNIPVNTSYAVSPHHSGVYPAHDFLYEAWKRVYNLKVTSTEEYPHLYPPRFRKGFIYKNIKVLPRQTCGLYTHTIFLKEYPKGQKWLEDSIHGGQLFQVVVDHPISIFMTHLSNYGNDRLALLVFDSLVKHLQCWTNIKLSSEHPVELAERYFTMFPGEMEPIWQNPCSDPRHKEIWSPEKNCKKLPSLLVVGPQKTGTTALYAFLKMHPDIISNVQSASTYEEVQFFGGHNYIRGLDWYMDFFPDVSNHSNQILFEKSANYFDAVKGPMRVSALLPNAKIITIFIDPMKRAYSWYQHMRSHGVAAAMYPFYKVITSVNSSDDRGIKALGLRCLLPGLYAQNLERWLKYFSPSQILILDGEKLRTDPPQVMLEVQKFLGVNIYDYNKRLRFDKHKGFYCQVTSQGGTHCLGKGKGRHYVPMDEKSQRFLEDYYSKPNKILADLLQKLERPLPNWLRPAR